MIITKIWFENDMICVLTGEGRTLWQSLLYYKKLRGATAVQRERYEMDDEGIHWPGLNEDISFESFEYDNPEPTGVARLFLTYPELNASAIGRRLGISQSLMAQYINGIKKPSMERERLILDEVLRIAQELVKVCA
ncbi:MAG: DUF2442 domain-containing protein [Bacteroidales bacterium]|nr:DUF2442 domain-containing protein [Bacteroidales bacterium]